MKGTNFALLMLFLIGLFGLFVIFQYGCRSSSGAIRSTQNIRAGASVHVEIKRTVEIDTLKR